MADNIRPISPLPAPGPESPLRKQKRNRRRKRDKDPSPPEDDKPSCEEKDADDPRGHQVDMKI